MKKIKCILMYIRMLFTLAWSGSWTPLVALLDTKKVNICKKTNKKRKKEIIHIDYLLTLWDSKWDKERERLSLKIDK